MLIKGNDDLRQDAIMEQLFSLVNNLLMSNESTKRRKLSLRTYNVVPLTASAGLIEWVEGTTTLAAYL